MGTRRVLQLRDSQDIPIQTAEEVTTFPAVTATKDAVPPRSLIMMSVVMTLPSCDVKTCFDFCSNSVNSHIGPNCIVYPLDYATMRGELQRGLQVLINLGLQEIKVEQGTVLGQYEQAPPEEVLITQEDIFGINVEGPWVPQDIEEEILKGDKKGFITSPADIDPREPIKLKDAEVAPQHREAFENLCSEFQDIFSKDSADLGKIPLLKMDIPTGDSLPSTQRPYTLALKHVQWVQEGIEILEKAGIIAKSVSPWASPIVIVPKKTAPGEPPRRGF